MKSKKKTGSLKAIIYAFIALVLFASIFCIWYYSHMSRQFGQIQACESNLINLKTAIELYAEDNEKKFPPSLDLLTQGISSYIKKLPVCPESKKPYNYKCNKDYDNFTIWCSKPDTHIKIHKVEGCWPQYSPQTGCVPNHP